MSPGLGCVSVGSLSRGRPRRCGWEFELGAAVRKLRVAHEWSQAELAAAAEMTQSAVARIEAGGTTPG
ncbi:helix-turn-helix transcriptional regulator [Pseudonocardia sp.]|uniref:helix-turn-helix transcriptional regulator n=1 Tax=Pseudonocardia sp. TaxID=60912 RepID=UPI0039C9D9A4